MNRRSFLQSVILGTLAAPFVTRRESLLSRIKRTLNHRRQLGLRNGLIVLSHAGFDAIDAQVPRHALGALEIEDVLCIRVPELVGDDYWVHATGLLG
jgi:hypothetical protein